MNPLYVDVILPLSLRNLFTYALPEEFAQGLSIGCRVAVEVGNRKVYSAIVYEMHDRPPAKGAAKPVLRILDRSAVVTPLQLQLWRWISDYYMCSMGEVMKNLLLPSLKMDAFRGEDDSFSLPNRYRPQTEKYVALPAGTDNDSGEMHRILDGLGRAKQQHAAFCYFLEKAVATDFNGIQKTALLRKELENAGFSPVVLRALMQKNILHGVEKESVPAAKTTPAHIPGEETVSGNRGSTPETVFSTLPILTEAQKNAYDRIGTAFAEKQVVLLHGISGSGKTEIYIHLIKDALERGKSTLFLLPEIAVTTQMIGRFEQVFGDSLTVFHSKNTDKNRFLIYHALLHEHVPRLIVGTRSAVSLPFRNLGLVIVDEEHDQSYKQQEPAPRYNARDAAIVLSKIHRCNTLLGSATPSVESYYNALRGKYALAELPETYSGVRLPKITVIDRRAIKKEPSFTEDRRYLSVLLVRRMEAMLQSGKQVILLQNRRGFSTYLECGQCGHVPQCLHCSVSLTYHKAKHRLVCHYCGYQCPPVSECPSCRSVDMRMKGRGTEKIEAEVEHLFPQARVQRFDLDAVKSASEFQKIIRRIHQNEIDIVVGTQMISKGFDFDHVGLVGVIDADTLLNFPDFRADEKAYQLISQASGRAGRRLTPGETIIQTAQPVHPVIQFLKTYDYAGMAIQQLRQRRKGGYPPFCRLIEITIKHRDPATVKKASDWITARLKACPNVPLSESYMPMIDRLKGMHIASLMLRIPLQQSLKKSKGELWGMLDEMKKIPGLKNVILLPDVDPL